MGNQCKLTPRQQPCQQLRGESLMNHCHSAENMSWKLSFFKGHWERFWTKFLFQSLRSNLDSDSLLRASVKANQTRLVSVLFKPSPWTILMKNSPFFFSFFGTWTCSLSKKTTWWPFLLKICFANFPKFQQHENKGEQPSQGNWETLWNMLRHFENSPMNAISNLSAAVTAQTDRSLMHHVIDYSCVFSWVWYLNKIDLLHYNSCKGYLTVFVSTYVNSKIRNQLEVCF